MITQERLRELLDYNPETGLFTWKQYRGGTAFAGSCAGRPNKSGHIQIMVDGVRYMAHRLAWLYVNGSFPKNEIDHINRIRSDNRIANLRPASNLENAQNRSRSSNNTSGRSDVTWNKKTKKWRARLTVGYKRMHLGYFESLDDAFSARAQAKMKYHTFHPFD